MGDNYIEVLANQWRVERLLITKSAKLWANRCEQIARGLLEYEYYIECGKTDFIFSIRFVIKKRACRTNCLHWYRKHQQEFRLSYYFPRVVQELCVWVTEFYLCHD